MFKFRTSFVAAAGLLASLAVPALAAPNSAVSAAGVPGGPFATAFRIQNLGSNPAQCSYDLYTDAGGTTPTFSSPISPNIAVGDSALVYTPNVTGLAAGTYSGVVNCSEPVAAVVNFSSTSSTGGQLDAYVGTTNPQATLYLPSAYNNFYGYYTSFRIQNTTGSAQTVRIDYYAPGATAPSASPTYNLNANGSVSVDQLGVAQLQRNVSYSAKVTSTTGGALAVTATIFGGPGTALAQQTYAYTAFSGGSTQPIYAPVIMRNYYGYNTATTIQNVGTAAANVRVTYSNGVVRTLPAIPANSSLVVSDFNDTSLQRNVLYSSKIESTNGQPLIVTVNESTPSTNRATTYEGLTAASVGTKVVAPIAMKQYSGYNSSITCQNVGTAATNISVTYSNSSVTNKQVGTNVQPGQTALIYQPTETGLPTNYLGSATMTASQPIACVVNQDKNYGAPLTQAVDFLGAYNAIKQ